MDRTTRADRANLEARGDIGGVEDYDPYARNVTNWSVKIIEESLF